jgi:hypothetical protein
MDDASKVEFITLRNLLKLRSQGSKFDHELISASSFPSTFSFDFRVSDDDRTSSVGGRCSLIHGKPIVLRGPERCDISSQSVEDGGSAQAENIRLRNTRGLVESLEATNSDLQDEIRHTMEQRDFWRILCRRVLFSGNLPMRLLSVSEAMEGFLILADDEWLVYENEISPAAIDPVLCMTSRFVSVVLDLSLLEAHVNESGKERAVVCFSRRRELLKLFLAALSYSSIHIVITESEVIPSSGSVPFRE